MDNSDFDPPFKESLATLTTKKAGTVKLTATAGTVSDSITLTVTAYSESDYAAGEKRYTAGGGAEPACISCHSPDGGVDHSPWYASEWNDQGVIGIFTKGERPDGSKLRTAKHAWVVSDAERLGVVAYLRSLALPPPRDDE